jgi:capsular exopolysaccharide synthesis family protein
MSSPDNGRVGSEGPASHALVQAAPQPRPVPARGRPSKPAEAGLDMLSLLRAFRRRWLLAVTLGLLLAAIAFPCVWVALPKPTATASALLLLENSSKGVIFDLGDRPAGGANMNTQLALARSRLVLNAALRDPKAASLSLLQDKADPVDWLEQNLKVSYEGTPEIMNISLASNDYAENLVVLVDLITKAYLDEILDKEKKRRQARLELLQGVVTKHQESIKGLRATLRTLQEKVGPGDKNMIALKQETARLEYDFATQELTQVRNELRTARLQSEAYDKGVRPEVVVNPRDVNSNVDQDRLVQQLEQKKQHIEEAMEEIRARAVQEDKDVALVPLRNELAQVREAADKRRRQLKKLVEQHLRETARQDAQSRQEGLKDRVVFLEKLEEILVKDVERLAKESQRFVKNALDLIDLMRENDEKEELVRTISREVSRIQVELDAPPRVRIVQEAVLRRPNETSRRAMLSGGTSLVLFLLSIVGVTLLEYRARRLGSTGEVITDLGLNVIGTLPAYRAGEASEGADYLDRRLVDSVDGARTMLLHIAQNGTLKVVMIASAVSGEGKTSLSGQLAASLARSGRRTLLIDADLRKPAMHHLFALELAPGLCEVLRGEASLVEAIRTTPVPNLSLLPAGRNDDTVLQNLAKDGGEAILQALRQDFDFILVDTSPILPVPDGLMLAQHADGVLLSLMERVSRVPLVKAACRKLSMVGAPVLGAVVNACREDASYGYAYSYSYPVTPRTADQPQA